MLNEARNQITLSSNFPIDSFEEFEEVARKEMTGRGKLGELALAKRQQSGLGRGLMTPGQFRPGPIKANSQQLPLATKKGKTEEESQHLQEVYQTPISPSQISPTRKQFSPFLFKSRGSLETDGGGDIGQKSIVESTVDDTINGDGTISASRDLTKGEYVDVSEEVTVQSLSVRFPTNIEKLPSDDLESSTEHSNVCSDGKVDDSRGQLQEKFRNDTTKMTEQLRELIGISVEQNKSSKAVPVPEVEDTVDNAEGEWKSFKMERQFNRILSNFTDGTSITDILRDFQNVIQGRSLSKVYPQYNELRIALGVLLTKVKNKQFKHTHMFATVKGLSECFPDEFEKEFPSLIEETKRGLVTVVASDSILSQSAEAFCHLMGEMYIQASQEESRFQKVMSDCIMTLVENWTYPDGIDITVEGHQVNVAETHARAVQILYEELKIQAIPRDTFLFHECLKISERIKESVLNPTLPRTVRELYLTALLNAHHHHHSGVQPVQTPTLVNEDKTKQDISGEDERGASKVKPLDRQYVPWDPYMNIEEMLLYLGFESELHRFKTNLIRDTVLNSPVEEIKVVFKEAKFPAGLIFEIVNYITEHGPFTISKRPLSLRVKSRSSSTHVSPEASSLENKPTHTSELQGCKSSGNITVTDEAVASDECLEKEYPVLNNPSVSAHRPAKVPQEEQYIKHNVNATEEQSSLPVSFPGLSCLRFGPKIASNITENAMSEGSPSEHDSIIDEDIKPNIPKFGLGRGAIFKDKPSPIPKLADDGNESTESLEGCNERSDIYSDEDNESETEDNCLRDYSTSGREYGGGYDVELKNDQFTQSREPCYEVARHDVKGDSSEEDVIVEEVEIVKDQHDSTQTNWRDHSNSERRNYDKQDFMGLGRGVQRKGRQTSNSRGHYHNNHGYSNRGWTGNDGKRNNGKVSRVRPFRRFTDKELRETQVSSKPKPSFGSGRQPSCFKCGSKSHITSECHSKEAFFF